MKEQGLVSKYTMAQFKPQKSKVNEDVTTNTLNREFDNREELEVVVSDLT
jgi:putative transposase